MNERNKYYDLWKNQSDLLWRTVNFVSLVGMAIIGGWYVTHRDGESFLSCGILFIGVVVMAIYWLLLHRGIM